MSWDHFPWTVTLCTALWLVAWWSLARGRRAVWWVLAGWVPVAVFIGGLWWSLGRPPLRTLGETRLWYAAILPLCGCFLEWRRGLGWSQVYCTGVAALFLWITWLHPESHDKSLMPALQSPWFVPHVVVYLVAYAFLTAASLAGLRGWWREFRGLDSCAELQAGDEMAWTGFSFLTLGLIFGAIWAKEAWGHYWTWDPKETWAFLTWAAYLSYIHIRSAHGQSRQLAFGFLSLSSVVLLLCWFGVNYMPSAMQSVHTYTR